MTDLYDTEGEGGFPGISFMARPVVGGHFAFLTLGKACGGKAGDGLAFLDVEEEGDGEGVRVVRVGDQNVLSMAAAGAEL